MDQSDSEVVQCFVIDSYGKRISETSKVRQVGCINEEGALFFCACKAGTKTAVVSHKHVLSMEEHVLHVCTVSQSLTPSLLLA